MRSRLFPWSPAVPLSLLLLAPLLVTGCGSAAPIPVSGKVTIDNKPLTTGSLTFRPDKGKGNTNTVEPVGTIGEDGSYTLETNGKPGAPPGVYKVIVFAMGKPKDTKDPYALGPSLVNKKYTSDTTTDLSVTVAANAAPDAYDLKLTR